MSKCEFCGDNKKDHLAPFKSKEIQTVKPSAGGSP